jgi:hypothetical protein
VMNKWASFLSGETEDNVVPLRATHLLVAERVPLHRVEPRRNAVRAGQRRQAMDHVPVARHHHHHARFRVNDARAAFQRLTADERRAFDS